MEAQRFRAIRRKSNQAAAQVLRRLSTLPRVRSCWHHAITPDGSVGVRARPADVGCRVNFVGLFTCGSCTGCPSCADKIMPRRAAEILALIDAHYTAGGQVMAVTYTLGHRRDDSLGSLWDCLGRCWEAARGVRMTSRRAMKGHVVGWVRNVETTWGYANGWHVHVHALMLLTGETDELAADRIAAASFHDWREKAIALGMTAPSARAFKAKLLDLSESVEAVAGYLAKSTYETAAWELAGGQRKLPAGGHYTAFGLLERLVDRLDDRDGELDKHGALWLQLWREWEQAAHGRRVITYSQGVRKLYGVDAERSDQELADDDLDLGAVFASLSARTWAAIRYTFAHQLQAFVELGSVGDAPERLASWLAANGHESALELVAG